jgi:tRNA pseudouridine32 synthase/23S rRNA pseudouridine746 synthase
VDNLLREPYHYQGTCPESGQLLRLERTLEAEQAARQLMAELPEKTEGKMYGVLLTAEGTILRAFSGTQLEDGWVPPIYFHDDSGGVPEHLAVLKGQLQALSAHPLFAQLSGQEQVWKQRLDAFQQQARRAKQQRDEARQNGAEEAALVLESQREGTARRQLRAQQKSELEPLRQQAQKLRDQALHLKRERRELSAGLQRQMHEGLSQALSAGQAWSLASLFPAGPPTGTGECCAPKLLVEAARRGLTPTGLAEFWWGPPLAHRQAGHFYAACQERCQPLLGPLLARLRPLHLLYQDEDLLAVVKPPGVLTLPGRQSWTQDSLWRRLQRDFPQVLPVHRLDMETSGICLWALNPNTQRLLQRQFAERSLEKTYEALLSRLPAHSSGCLDLPLGPDPQRPGCYRLDPEGKPSRTDFLRLEGQRYRFQPRTGRSHQIRVHAAQGLQAPIQGDRLYGGGEGPLRLHACRLRCLHRGQPLELEARAPF